MQRPRVLFILNHLPWPYVRSGNGQRTDLICRALLRIADVEILIVRPPDTSEAASQWATIADAVRADLRIRHIVDIKAWPQLHSSLPGFLGRFWMTVREYYRRYQPHAAALEWLGSQDTQLKYDLIVGRYLQPTLLAGAAAAQQRIPVILDFDDLDFQKFNSGLKIRPWTGLNGWIGSKIISGLLYLVCRSASRQFSHIWVTNPKDRLLAGGGKKVSVLPNIPYVSVGQKIVPCAERKGMQSRILFVGTLHYDPNIHGLKLFLKDVWPAVRARHPAATLEIVGTGISAEMIAFLKQYPQVEVTGFVDDIRKAYERADLTIAPVFWGGGTNIKVLESFAYGRVCIGTSFSMGNFDFPADLALQIKAENVTHMGKLINAMLVDCDSRRNTAQQLRDWTSANYSYELFERIVMAAVSRVLKIADRKRHHE